MITVVRIFVVTKRVVAKVEIWAHGARGARIRPRQDGRAGRFAVAVHRVRVILRTGLFLVTGPL